MTDPLFPQLVPWLNEAGTLAEHRFADARQHGIGGDLVSATQRLTDLQVGLAGPRGVFERARRDFFRRAFRHHQQTLDRDIRRPDVSLRRDLEDAVAIGPILGREDATNLGRLIQGTIAKLGIAHAAYPVSSLDARPLREAGFRAWATQYHDRVNGWARRTLSDHQVHIFHQTGIFLIKPELRNWTT